MYNLNVGTYDHILICSVCDIAQECPPRSNSVKVRFCLGEWPAIKCEACCNCRMCTVIKINKFLDSCTYDQMMVAAVSSYMSMPVGDFDFLCSMEL